MHLDRLKIFYHAAKAKSFTDCGLNLSSSSISRHISKLEHQVKAILFHRYTRNISLTEQGEILFKFVERLFLDVENIRETLNASKLEPQGSIRVVGCAGWVSGFLLDLVPDFLKKNPKIKLSLLGTNQIPDFLHGQVDASIFPFPVSSSHLINQVVGKFRLKLYASKEYIEKHGTPQTIEDLDSHNLIFYGDSPHLFTHASWILTLGTKTEPRIPYTTVNNSFKAICAGLGIGTLCEYNSRQQIEENNLIPILPEVNGPEDYIYYTYPANLEKSLKIKAFGAFLEAALKKE